MNRNSVTIVMLIVIASPFLFHLRETPERVSIAAVIGTLSLSCMAAGGFTKWLRRMKEPKFAAVWAAIWILVAAAPYIALKFS